jgi:hypothetical protein
MCCTIASDIAVIARHSHSTSAEGLASAAVEKLTINPLFPLAASPFDEPTEAVANRHAIPFNFFVRDNRNLQLCDNPRWMQIDKKIRVCGDCVHA